MTFSCTKFLCITFSCALIFISDRTDKNWTCWNSLNVSPCSSSFLEKFRAGEAAPCWLTYLPVTDSRVGLYLQRSRFPSSSHTLSCFLHLLINSAIALAGMATDSDHLGSWRAPTCDAAELYSPFTHSYLTVSVWAQSIFWHTDSLER